MSEDNNQAGSATAEGLREVPTDLSEYKKFVADGGHEHNARIRGREEAEKAAQDAGLKLAAGEDGEQHKPHKNGFQARINRLQRKIGERDQRIADLERASAQPNGHPPQVPPDAEAPAAGDRKPDASDKRPPKPQEKDFTTWADYSEALMDWKLADALATRAEASGNKGTELPQAPPEYNARVDELKELHSDWKQSFEGLENNSFTDAMYLFLIDSDKGPDITYYLAKHRKELARIRELHPMKQVLALGKIEERLSEESEETGDEEGEDKGGAKPAKPAQKKPAPADDEDEDEEDDEEPVLAKRAAAKHSKAPPPAKPLGGRGGSDDPMPDPANFVEYAAWSKRLQAKGVKR